MKHDTPFGPQATALAFSALGRAVWDETDVGRIHAARQPPLSVLSVEPYGMKLWEHAA